MRRPFTAMLCSVLAAPRAAKLSDYWICTNVPSISSAVEITRELAW
jgi:hypothetical protein